MRARHRVEAAAARLVGATIRRLPRAAVLRLGRIMGRVWAGLDPRHLAIAAENLRAAFPEWDEGRPWSTAREVYSHFAQVMLDLLWLEGRTKTEVLAIVDSTAEGDADAAETAGRGCIFVSGHFGNWEIHAISHAWRTGRPVGLVVRALDNPALDARLCAVREMSGNVVIQKQKAIAQILRLLRQGGSVAILIDQNVQHQDGIFVDFFGRPAATTTVAAALAVKTGCALVPCYAELTPDGRYRAVREAPIHWTPSGDREAEIADLTQKMTAVIEGWVRRRPEQWLWMHRRWKTQPPVAGGPSRAGGAKDHA